MIHSHKLQQLTVWSVDHKQVRWRLLKSSSILLISYDYDVRDVLDIDVDIYLDIKIAQFNHKLNGQYKYLFLRSPNLIVYMDLVSSSLQKKLR